MINVLIYGAGAIGSFLGYLLSEISGCEDRVIENIALLGRRSHIESIKENGLKIGFFESFKVYKFRHCFSSLADLNESDFSPNLIVITAKTYSLPQIGRELKESGILDGKSKDAKLILLMNGMGNRELLEIESGRVFEGITSIGVVLSQDGHIELKGKGKTIFEGGIGIDIQEFMNSRFAEKNFEIEFTKDFKNHQWTKLFSNAVINPITAITRKKNGVIRSKQLDKIVEKVIEECTFVAGMEGYHFDKTEVMQFVYLVASKTSSNTSSMLQDIMNGRITEIESINGYIIRLAKKHALKVPVNETLYALLKAIETHNMENPSSSQQYSFD
jgi:2-dehydropantoate 2-reductase